MKNYAALPSDVQRAMARAELRRRGVPAHPPPSFFVHLVQPTGEATEPDSYTRDGVMHQRLEGEGLEQFRDRLAAVARQSAHGCGMFVGMTAP
jgi:hypothetical protein